ncbi:MAG: tRNA 2-thiouridine(34) synthase MnmA [candidate division WOR-3 bacterium]
MKVILAISGGIDSSTALFLLKNMGAEIEAITLFLWDKNSHKRSCCSIEAVQRARRICYRLKVKHTVIDSRRDFEEIIVNKSFVEEYKKGLTPNPCVFCNRFFKFGALLEEMKKRNFDYLATGHYARIYKENGKYFIRKAKDKEKDQSYFLSMILPLVVKHLIFPLGDLTKKEVLNIAERENLLLPSYEESQDLCFIEKSIQDFLKERLGEKKGFIFFKDNAIKEHSGFYNFTIGQRKGLNLSLGERVYVKSIDPEKNVVEVDVKKNVMKKEILVVKLNLFDKIKGEKKLKVKIRNLHRESDARVKFYDDYAEVNFEEEQFAPTPGQIAAFYDDDILLGGGVIYEKR